MFVGKVIGSVWSTVKWPQLGGHKLLLVRPYHLSDLIALGGRSQQKVADPDPRREAVVCVDLLDAGVGDDVVVAFGHAARVAAERPHAAAAEPTKPGGAVSKAQTSPSTTTPIDAAVVAIVDVNGFSLSDHIAP